MIIPIVIIKYLYGLRKIPITLSQSPPESLRTNPELFAHGYLIERALFDHSRIGKYHESMIWQYNYELPLKIVCQVYLSNTLDNLIFNFVEIITPMIPSGFLLWKVGCMAVSLRD